jgi:hypothetical protein
MLTGKQVMRRLVTEVISDGHVELVDQALERRS